MRHAGSGNMNIRHLTLVPVSTEALPEDPGSFDWIPDNLSNVLDDIHHLQTSGESVTPVRAQSANRDPSPGSPPADRW